MNNTLNTEAQVRYLIQWFQEWSDLQRSDFLPIMAEKYTNRVYVNGIVNSIASVECREKPMSLFECRVKLFREWFSQWNSEQKDRFLRQVSELDPIFSDKLDTEIGGAMGEPYPQPVAVEDLNEYRHTNGHATPSDGDIEVNGHEEQLADV